MFTRAFDRFMIAISVRRFHDHNVCSTLGRRRIANDWQSIAANVAGKHDAFCLAMFGYFEHHRSGSQNVPRFNKLCTHSGNDIKPFFVRNTDHLPLRLRCIIRRVQRRRMLLSASRQKFGILFLDMCGVCQHDGAQVAGGGSGPDRVPESLVDQKRQATGMIDMRVRQHDCVESFRIERQVLVLPA